MSRILLVEDEEQIRDNLKMNLEFEGYEVVAVGHARNAMQHVKGEHFDCMILDIMLPEIDGLQLCEQIRLHNTQVPIMFLTAKNTSEDRIYGLKRGADDYLTKPFALEEFILRVKNLLRRSGPRDKPRSRKVSFGNNWVDFNTYEAEGTAGAIQLTNKESKLLQLLIERENEVVSRQQILQSVWGYEVFPTTRTIDNFILAFRKYFEEDSKNPKHFHSVRGVGYKFIGPVN